MTIVFFSLPSWAKVYLPNHLSAQTKNRQLQSYYNSWISKYLKGSNGRTPGGGFYVEMFGPNGVGSEGHITTSEAMGYGMLMTVMAHRFDANAKRYFDGLFNMFDKHRSRESRYTMSWVIHKTENQSRRSSSATDGDMDIALALIWAHQIWGSRGNINYYNQAVNLVNAILKEEINTANSKLMLGDWWHSQWREISRPSDWMGGHLRAFHKLTNKSQFLKSRDKIYQMARTLQTNYSPSTGLIPDFIATSSNRPAPANTLEGVYDGDYYYNSARVPLRFVIDYQETSDVRIQSILNQMMSFFVSSSNRNPANIKSGYRLNGRVIGNYYDSAFVAPVIAAATISPNYQSFVNQGWDLLLRRKSNYYSDSITLLSLFYLSDNWGI